MGERAREDTDAQTADWGPLAAERLGQGAAEGYFLDRSGGDFEAVDGDDGHAVAVAFGEGEIGINVNGVDGEGAALHGAHRRGKADEERGGFGAEVAVGAGEEGDGVCAGHFSCFHIEARAGG